MDIVVRGRNCDVTAQVKAVTEEKLAKLTRLAADISRVEVDYSEIRNPRVAEKRLCEVTVHLKRHFVKAHAAATEMLAALDLVIDKVEHQVHRLKEKRVSRKHPRRRQPGASAAPLVEEGPLVPELEQAGENGEDATLARIVKTKRFTIKPMTTEEAALQMDLLGHDFFLFTDADTGHATVLYRRRDGHLGTIEAVG
jgi:putative sigma-54 modulation protein